MTFPPESKREARHIIAPRNCMGCALCANVCPKDAIAMVWNDEGFLIPAVDVGRCVECGLCVNRCIALEETSERMDIIEDVEAYGAWNCDDELLRQSSSGGVFTALAEYIFSVGGCVFGVVWQDKETAAFRKAEKQEELTAMRGSKYVPACPGYVYRAVRDELKAGRYVLFSGTPCQVHALKAFLKKDDERLLTLDIACHGVPSRLILQKYIREEEKAKGGELARIDFRSKATGWANYNYCIAHHFSNGENYYVRQGESPFMQMFIADTALNLSCYHCPYAHSPRQGDLSVGDYWGVEAYHPEWPLNEGVSALIVSSEKGRKILPLLLGRLHVHAEPFEHICKQNKNVYAKEEVTIHPNRPYAMEKLKDKQASLQDAIVQSMHYATKFGIRYRTNSLLLRGLRRVKRLLWR